MLYLPPSFLNLPHVHSIMSKRHVVIRRQSCKWHDCPTVAAKCFDEALSVMFSYKIGS
ncbi:hypothetical protein PAHAL_8G013100 [Panicum hallii]|uniref:Uncharacterized protein n=1 Tax=Panicum hallii TaxID=206008 RepID=A0A2T8I759_9POAL|nr:hypothetical protein PAHAL_8G013100 [Panicum hallii]